MVKTARGGVKVGGRSELRAGLEYCLGALQVRLGCRGCNGGVVMRARGGAKRVACSGRGQSFEGSGERGRALSEEVRIELRR